MSIENHEITVKNFMKTNYFFYCMALYSFTIILKIFLKSTIIEVLQVIFALAVLVSAIVLMVLRLKNFNKTIQLRFLPAGIDFNEQVYPVEHIQEIRMTHLLLQIMLDRYPPKVYLIEASDKTKLHQLLTSFCEEHGVPFRQR